jgi:serine/threonine protein kinase
MSDPKPEHPAAELLAAYALGQLGEEQACRVRRHLECCERCRRFLESTPHSGLIDLSPTDLTSEPLSGLTPVPVAFPVTSAGKPQSTLWPEDARSSQHGNTSFTLAAGAEVPAGLGDHPRYEILQLLGSGGMGVVYKARHRFMDRLVALKVIHPVLVDRPGMVTRFEREVRAAARLSHPNIVAAYDAGHGEGIHFFVMEYVEGTDLDQVVAKGPLTVALACGYARQTALGLAHAHERGMVHRDIKPHNLMLTPEGCVKILDFGLARFVSETMPVDLEADLPGLPADAQATASMLASLTSTSGGLVGTADYAAPDAARDSSRGDGRADLYSLGCTLYRLLTGRVPFPGGSVQDKLRAHRHQRPTPADQLRPALPAGLAGVLDRLMAKDPAQRYQTAAEAAAALATFASGTAQQVLVVDDVPNVRELMRLILEKEGFSVATAEHGLDALQQLRAGLRPEAILLDLMMPVMDGWQFLRELRADPALASIPTVLITAADPAQAAEVARGAACCLRKPVEPHELTSFLRGYVRPA